MEAKGRLKKEAGHSRSVGGRFHKHENLHMRLVLAPKPHLCILLPESGNFGKGLNGVQSHIPSTQSQRSRQSLKTAPAVGTGVYSKVRRGDDGPLLPGSASTSGHVLNDLQQQADVDFLPFSFSSTGSLGDAGFCILAPSLELSHEAKK